MKMKLNCPNCGAPVDAELHKCPYCNTSYFDMSSVDIDGRTPFYLRIKTKMDGNSVFITQFVKPVLETIEIDSDTKYLNDKHGNLVNSWITSKTVTTNLSFVGLPIPKKENVLLAVEIENNDQSNVL